MEEGGRRYMVLTAMGVDLLETLRKEPMTEGEFQFFMEGDEVAQPKGLMTYATLAQPSPPDMSVRQQRRWAQRKGYPE